MSHQQSAKLPLTKHREVHKINQLSSQAQHLMLFLPVNDSHPVDCSSNQSHRLRPANIPSPRLTRRTSCGESRLHEKFMIILRMTFKAKHHKGEERKCEPRHKNTGYGASIAEMCFGCANASRKEILRRCSRLVPLLV